MCQRFPIGWQPACQQLKKVFPDPPFHRPRVKVRRKDSECVRSLFRRARCANTIDTQSEQASWRMWGGGLITKRLLRLHSSAGLGAKCVALSLATHEKYKRIRRAVRGVTWGPDIADDGEKGNSGTGQTPDGGPRGLGIPSGISGTTQRTGASDPRAPSRRQSKHTQAVAVSRDINFCFHRKDKARAVRLSSDGHPLEFRHKACSYPGKILYHPLPNRA